MRRVRVMLPILLLCAELNSARAQVSSIGAIRRQEEANRPPEKLPREVVRAPKNFVYERFGWTAATPVPLKTFKPGDLITVIVREQKQWAANSELQQKSKFDLKSELDAFIKATDGGIGAATFQRGKPTIDYKFNQNNKTQGDSQREDKFTTRMEAQIIDVKPNGVLVIEGRAKFTHDEEFSEITIIGNCRKEDVTADNTVLSTQIADKEVHVKNSGAIKNAATRGWVSKVIDALKPW
ncbi:MAG: flagellar basal body L-ring protein FlgH [Planctomycetes bacterium]|nr:flagellar basal body L-ring protein FlgH [Planctomycetota bacterium]MBI3833886.1 flagellar basal body L-ring protein FlgH [Planctomycetota bacterium]